MSTENDLAHRLAIQLRSAVERRHKASETWQQGHGAYVFDVELTETRPGGPQFFAARIVVTLSRA